MTGPEPGGQPQQGTQAGQAMPPGFSGNGQRQPQIPPDVLSVLARQMGVPGGDWFPGTDEQLNPESLRLAQQAYETEKRHLARAESMRRDVRRELDAQARQPIALISGQEMRQRQPPPFLVEGLIPDRSIGVIFGETGAYKSFLVLNLLLCSGSGADFLGHAVYGTGWGVYVMGEGQHDAGLRLDAAIGAHLGFTDERLAYIEQPFPLSDDAAVDEVIGRCRELGAPVRLVAFDSFADFYGAGDNENSSTDMQRLIAGMKRISAALGCVVMACAHTGHGGKDEDGGDRPPPPRLRGSSRFRQAWDFELMATGSALVPTKNRYGPRAAPVPYRMEAAGGSLAVSAGPAAQPSTAEDAPTWPHPCPPESMNKVWAAVRATPGMTLEAIQRAARVRRADVTIALLKGEQVGLFVNTGTRGRPAWEWGGPLAVWLEGVGKPRPAMTAVQQRAHAEWLQWRAEHPYDSSFSS